MSFYPRKVNLLGPLPEPDYLYLGLTNNKSYLCLAGTGNDINSYGMPYVDCSGAEEWPTGFLGNRRGQGRLYGWPCSLDNHHIHLLGDNRIVAIDRTNSADPDRIFEVWAMNEDLPAGCECVSTRTFTSPHSVYGTHDDESCCGVAVDDYQIVRNDFHLSDNHPYIDCYRLHDGVESERVGFLSDVITPMTIPSMWTHFIDIMDDYTFTWRSQHTLSAGERAKMIMQVSSSSTFAGTPTQAESSAIDQGTYYEATFAWSMHASTTRYARCKRHDELIADPNTYSDSGWSDTVTINARERADELVLNGSPALIPYYCYQDYDAAQEHQYWAVYIIGTSRTSQDAALARIQIATTETFDTVLYDNTVSYFRGANGDIYAGVVDNHYWYGWGYQWLDHGVHYYARSRNENADGSVVSEWSNVFELDADNDGADHVDRTNFADDWTVDDPHTFVPETHWLGEQTIYDIASESVHVDGHTYVLVSRMRYVWDTQSVTVDHFYGSSWLADYDGSAVTLTEIEPEEEGVWRLSNYARADIVEFGGKIYAGWSDTQDVLVSIYDWCEITGGVVGEIHHVPLPAEIDPALGSAVWATMSVVHGDLRVIASLDTGSEYIMGIANVLSTDPTTMKVYPNIKTGWSFTKDPWLGSIWFDYENYDSTESAICWLGSGQSNAVWYMGI